MESTEHQRLEGLHESLTHLAAGSAQREKLLAWIADAQQEERQRIAADIHDDTVQVMGAVSMRLELALGRK